MPAKFLLAATMALGLGAGMASAQTSERHDMSNPIQGEKVERERPMRVEPNAEAEAKADKQPSGTENGNQPDRAGAGGGAR